MTPEELLDTALAGNADAEALKHAMLSPEFANALQERIEANPAEQRRRELVVEYAERHGGMTLQFLQMFDGAYWGTGIELTFEQCPRVLGLSSEKLERMYDDMLDEIRPHLPAKVTKQGSRAGRVRRQRGVSRDASAAPAHQPGWRTRRGRTA